MKQHLLILLIMLAFGSAVAQTSTIANLSATGSNIKWYAASTGGSALATSTVLVNGTTYYASQTVNGVESATRLAVTANFTSIPTTAGHTSTETAITWNWNASANATGYKWNTTNNYATATDLGNTLTVTQTGRSCNTSYTIYVWAYNTSCNTAAATFSKSTSACANFTVASIDFGNSGTANQLDAGVVKDFIQIVFSKEINPTTIYSGLSKGGTLSVPGISFSGFWNGETFAMNVPADWHLGTCGETGMAIQDAGSGGDPSVYSLSLSADGTVLSMYLYNAGGRLLNNADASNYLWYTPDSSIKAADGTSISGSYYREPNGSTQF